MRRYLEDRIVTFFHVPYHEAHRCHVWLHRNRIRHIWWRRHHRTKGIPRGMVRVNVLGGLGKKMGATDFLKVYERKNRRMA